MTDKILENHAGQEDYIWAMRASVHRHSLFRSLRRQIKMARTDSTEKRRISAASWASNYDPTLGEDQTRLMASLVPDEVIYNFSDYSHRQYDACFLFGDVSDLCYHVQKFCLVFNGTVKQTTQNAIDRAFTLNFYKGFTELCEKYSKTGNSGPSRMTQALNKYLGSMVQEVMSHDGDVLKFSGDAFLAMFKTTERIMRDAVHESLDCALVIQRNYGSYLTDVGIVIKVKLAISAGPVTFALIGDEDNSHYVVVGKPIWDVKAAEHISSAGDIIVAPAAWHYVNPNEYKYQDMPDGVHIKLIGVGPNWRSVQRSNLRQRASQSNRDDISTEESSSSSINTESIYATSSVGTTAATMNEFALRPAVDVAARTEIIEFLRKFIIAPVMKSIYMNEPFEYLTEMRQAVIVFINVVSIKLETRETVILADQSYKIVCRVVNKMNGCVNKVSLFDKDLMFVVIFGLRGLKHELECQVALKCAQECHQAIKSLPNVLTCSIGVTTGKTYCGVFGHTLRREYTVISLVVNKAARLMVAYKNIITCDRETFLHSKLEAKNFVLQPRKYLKGITHPGPVYEYRAAEVDHYGEIEKINCCPLLGREEYMGIYKRLLEIFVSGKKSTGPQHVEKIHLGKSTRRGPYKMFLILGEARQGKTRLLDEMVYCTPSDLPVNRFSLTVKDEKISYQTIRLIFNEPLDLTADSTPEEVQNKLVTMLRQMQVPDLLCVLNEVFGVKFDITELFESLNVGSRKSALRKIIRQLCYASFVATWVIAIDNCEFIDSDSWELFNILFDIKTVFIVATKGKSNVCETPISVNTLRDSRVKTVNLRPIEKGFLGALTCQILDVYAISPELENAIQKRSNGNPGWIESFLISMIQEDMLHLLKANLKDINDLGLVAPPLYMMSRLTNEETLKWKHVMEEKPSEESLEDTHDWQRYIDSCRDSYMNITVRGEIESIDSNGRVPVCVTAPNFSVGEEEAELSRDTVMLRTFDSLNFFEQLLSKCAAILGNQFQRDMLVYVMATTNMRQTALAVQKLFEIKILSCAKGDFTEQGRSEMYKVKLINPTHGDRPICKCVGINFDKSCYDLPKYASCGYMQFQSTTFRDIIYNLLTYDQKREFHQRAIKYIERETRRCKACGGDQFENIIGIKEDKDLMTVKDQKLKLRQDPDITSVQTDLASRAFSRRSVSTFSARLSITSSINTIHKKRFDEKSMSSALGAAMDESKDNKSQFHFFKFGSRKLKHDSALTRDFFEEDYAECQCNLILNTAYVQLIEHCLGAGDLDKALQAQIEYTYNSINARNIPLALRILDNALDVVKQKTKAKEENMWKLSLIRGKIFTLIGSCRLQLGNLDEAAKSVYRALSEYRIEFPTGMRKAVRRYTSQFKHFLGMNFFPRMLVKRLDHWETIFANNLSECLSHLCTIFMAKNEWRNAELAAMWSFQKAVEAFSDFQMMCTTCMNVINVAQHFQSWRMCVQLEMHALKLMHLKEGRIEMNDLKAVAKLYAAMFTSRLLRSNMDRAIHIGYIVLRLCSSLNATQTLLPVLPNLLQSLILGKQMRMALSLLDELDYLASEDTDCSGKIWYFTLCICFHLETGYTVVSYEMCEDFYLIEGGTWMGNIRDADSRKRYFVVMWLWCIRNEKWEDAYLWRFKANDFSSVSAHDSVSDKFTALYLLEGLLLLLVSKMDQYSLDTMLEIEQDIKSLIKALEKAAKFSKIILPRLYHLKAYYRYIKYSDRKVYGLIDKALSLANKYGNELEMAWIEHSINAWNKKLSPSVTDFWKEHAEADNVLNFYDYDTEDEITGFFTLPTPLYL